MNVIKQPDQRLIDFIGYTEKKKNRKYRWNKYCIVNDNENIVVMYNTFNGSVIQLSKREYNNAFEDLDLEYKKFLYRTFYIVPETFNEDNIIKTYKEINHRYIEPSIYLDNQNSYTILTTTKCNACCPYCYELPLKGKHHMTPETADKVADYIIEHHIKNDNIELGWFGGEPLYNMEAIDIIVNKIRKHNYSYNSSMISNGYLFNEDVVERARHIWNLSTVQITLDGVDEEYNSVKRYIYKDDPNPFRTVIGNIHTLLKYGVNVSVRMNVNVENIERIERLINFLGEEFKQYDRMFTMYVWEIFGTFNEDIEYKKKLYDGLTKLNNLIIKYKLGIYNSIDSGIKFNHCMVDSGAGVTINPDGDLGVCEHFIDNGFIGHIDDENINKNIEVLKQWRHYIKNDSELCMACPIRPICIKMEKCPDEHECSEYERDYKISRVVNELNAMIEDFNKNSDCCNCN